MASHSLVDWVFGHVRDSLLENYRYASTHLRAIATFGLIGEPLYYLIWTWTDPEGYESLSLRLAAAGFCVPLLFAKSAERQGRELAIAAHFALASTFCLPFFFGYLLFMNAQDSVGLGSTSIHWPMQHLVALLLMILLFPIGSIAALGSILGTSAAWVLYRLCTKETAPSNEVLRFVWQLTPIYVFVLAAGSVFNRNRSIIDREKVRTMAAVGSTIAHELRTPFLGIRALAEGIQKYLPTLLRTYDLAVQRGLPVDPIRHSHVDALNLALSRINGEIDYSNRIVDMLLINSSESPVHESEFSVFAAGACIEEALARYPFSGDTERDLVTLHIESDFRIHAPRVLVVHVLFNLIKNGIYYVRKAGGNQISISTRRGGNYNQIIVHDDGTGIAPHIVGRIFDRFFTTTETGHGAGIGLSFCKLVMEGIGGSIHCESAPGSYTRFTLEFPEVANE